jgi:hypothetical protein
MMQAANYTGSWCTMAKLDGQMRPKLLEVNARYCGTMGGNDALFLTAFVPLAGAIGKAFPAAKVNHALYNGTRRSVYRMILEDEEKILRTGGGQYKKKWITTEKFDPNLRLDHIYERFIHILKYHSHR